MQEAIVSRQLLSASEKVEKIMKRKSLPFIKATNKMRKGEGRENQPSHLNFLAEGIHHTKWYTTI